MFYHISLEDTKTEFAHQGWITARIRSSRYNENVMCFEAKKFSSDLHTGGRIKFIFTVCADGRYTAEQIDCSSGVCDILPVDLTHPDVIVATNILSGALSVRYSTGAENCDDELMHTLGNPPRDMPLMFKLTNMIENLGVGWELANIPTPAGSWHYIRERHATMIEHLRINQGGALFTLETTDAHNWSINMPTIQSPSLAMTMCSLWNVYIRYSGLLHPGLDPIALDTFSQVAVPAPRLPHPNEIHPAVSPPQNMVHHEFRNPPSALDLRSYSLPPLEYDINMPFTPREQDAFSRSLSYAISAITDEPVASEDRRDDT